MRISVVGAGYVGLVTAACLAEVGHDVVCMDIDKKKVEKINKGVSPIYEKDLDDILSKVVGERLKATTNLEKAVLETDVTFICVGTPSSGKGEISLDFIRKVSEDIGKILSKKQQYHVVVVKSSVVPGTTNDVVIPILERRSGKFAGVDFGISVNPPISLRSATI